MDHSLENRIIEFMDRAEPMLREYEAIVADRGPPGRKPNDADFEKWSRLACETAAKLAPYQSPPKAEQAEIGQGQAAQEPATAPSEAAPQASDPDPAVAPSADDPAPAPPAEPPEAQDGQTDHTAPGAAI